MTRICHMDKLFFQRATKWQIKFICCSSCVDVKTFYEPKKNNNKSFTYALNLIMVQNIYTSENLWRRKSISFFSNHISILYITIFHSKSISTIHIYLHVIYKRFVRLYPHIFCYNTINPPVPSGSIFENPY